jgi:hypothetical protein
MAAFAALHANGLTGDFVVADLILRFAVVAEEFQRSSPLRITEVN